MPLVTIDGEDARDFDDAVFAEPDGDGLSPDRRHRRRRALRAPRQRRWTARRGERGNSVYFPDRVVPMLPEALSNGWCSLRPNEDRGCLFVEMRIDARRARRLSHRFGRGLMRSAARLTYEQVQEAHDGRRDNLGLPARARSTAPSALLLAARQARGTLDLDLPERKVVLDDRGPRGQRRAAAAAGQPPADRGIHGAGQCRRRRGAGAAAHALHVSRPCAALGREARRRCATFLHGLGISLPPGDQIHPRDLDRVLTRVAGTEEAPLVNEVMLRSQSQAAYSPDNIGHFGLALPRYAHFTSPIRRYADLLVHRALIAALELRARTG